MFQISAEPNLGEISYEQMHGAQVLIYIFIDTASCSSTYIFILGTYISYSADYFMYIKL